MNLFFIHRNMPAQFRHLIAALASGGRHRLLCIGQRIDPAQPGIGRVRYPAPNLAAASHPLLAGMAEAVANGQAVAELCARLAREVMRPDVIVGHPGWGETLYLKQCLPEVPLLLYGEYFYRTRGADVDFDPATPQSPVEAMRTRTMNAPLLLALDEADWIMTPTRWQAGLHPSWARARMSVLFDGVDAAAIRPDRQARFTLPDGRVLTPEDEVVTFAARGLEPYRGFPSFMRALPELLRRRPAARVVIAGGDAAVYGRNPAQGGSWRAVLSAELGLDPNRVHFTGTLPHPRLLQLLQVSTVHVYLTVPFVLSWSLLEAMAAGCMLVASATAPVIEVVEHGVNGWLVDFFDAAGLAASLVAAIEQRREVSGLRRAARETVLSRYDLAVCLPPQIDLLETLAAGRAPG